MDKYYDDDKQIAPLPRKWMELTRRFRVGDTVVFLEPRQVWIGEERHDMAGLVGVVEKVNNGYGVFPPRWHDDGTDGMWIGEHEGWLSVYFPISPYMNCITNGKPSRGLMALHPSEEGKTWVKEYNLSGMIHRGR